MNHSIENDQANPHFPIAAPQIYEAGDDWWLVTGDVKVAAVANRHKHTGHCQAAGDRIIVPHGLEPWSRTPWRWEAATQPFPAESVGLWRFFCLDERTRGFQADGLKHWWGVCRLLVDTCWCLLYVFVYLRHHQNLHVRPSPTSSNGWVPQSGSIFFVDLKLLLLYNRVQTL